MLLLFALALIILFGYKWAKYLFLTGAMGYLFSVVWYQPKGENTLRIKRLIRMAHFSGLLWTASAIAYMLHSAMWPVFAGIACVFMLYSNIFLSSVHAKKKNTTNDKE